MNTSTELIDLARFVFGKEGVQSWKEVDRGEIEGECSCLECGLGSVKFTVNIKNRKVIVHCPQCGTFTA